MASKVIDFNREIIPTWRRYEETAKAGELEFSRKAFSSVEFCKFKDYVSAWKNKQDIRSASDLVNAGLVSGNTKALEVLESAYYIKTHDHQSSQLVIDVATSILASQNQHPDKIAAVDNYEERLQNLLSQFESQEATIKARIGLLRKQVSSFCYNPIAYCELARSFMDLGLMDKAEYYMKIALHLAPNHRYVTRCGARLYLHKNRPDLAKRILVNNEWLKYDPWVLASEIAVESVMKRSSKYIKLGRQLVLSDNISPFSSSELSLAICKEDIKADKRKDGRIMFSRGMIKPNDNSLAQAESIIRFNPSFEINYNDYTYLNNRYEADTRLRYNNEDFHGAFESSLKWLLSYRFSKEPVSFASDIASTFLKRYDDAKKILNIGLESNPGDAGMLNNMAYICALTDDLPSAESILRSLNVEGVLSKDPSIGVCLLATTGMLRYRQGKFEEAREMYDKAIVFAMKSKNKSLADKAKLNMIREEVHNVKDYDKSILNDLDRLNTGSVSETVQLRKDILLEVESKQ